MRESGTGGSAASDEPRTRSRAPEEAFATLGNAVRIEILRAFRAVDEGGALSFTEIYDRLAIDSTSQLSYHLDVLTEGFLRKDDAGYRLTPAGDRVLRAVLAGTYTDEPTVRPVDIDGWCPDCDATALRAVQRPTDLAVICPGCETPVVTYEPCPAAVADRTSLEVLQSCDRRVHQAYATALQGTCFDCGGRTDLVVETDATGHPVDYRYVATCRQCRRQVSVPLSVAVLYHPAVVAFYWARGVNVLAVPLWAVHEYLRAWTTTVDATDPLHATVTVAYAGEELTVTVAGRPTVAAPVLAHRSAPLRASD